MSKTASRRGPSPLAISAAAASAAVLENPQLAAPELHENHPPPAARKSRTAVATPGAKHFAATHHHDDDGGNRQAELFYLQKQIQQQTPMVFILEDGSRVQGIVEWYDRHSIKVRGKSRVLIYKSAIKYLFKAGEVGAAPEK